MCEKESAAGGCLLAGNVWKFLWDPASGPYRLPNIVRDGLNQAGIKIPPFATIAVPNVSIPLLKLSFNLSQSTLSGLAAVEAAGFECMEGGEVTELILGLRFKKLSFRGRYSVCAEPQEKPVLEGLFFDDALGVTVHLETRLDYQAGPVKVEIPRIVSDVEDLEIRLKRTNGDETLFTKLQTWVANLWIVKAALKKAVAAGLDAQPVREALAKAIQAAIDQIGAAPQAERRVS